MRIALMAHAYAPSIGGTQTAASQLANSLAEAGHDVVVVTQTSGQPTLGPVSVLRRPSLARLVKEVRGADAVVQVPVSLRTLWPAALLGKPLVVVVATWLRRPDGRIAWRDQLKHLALRRTRVVAVSQAVAAHLPIRTTVIHNSYRDGVFRELPDVARELDLVFVGRLVSDKGADDLLRAIALLAASGRPVTASVVGDGPERSSLEELADNLGITQQVRFLGALEGSELNIELNRHGTIVVPSRWEEPFGIVALEGIAAGCVAVVSERGGLPEAAGPCGLTFPNGNVSVLADCLVASLDVRTRERLRADAASHLDAHRADVEARAYHALILEEVAGRG